MENVQLRAWLKDQIKTGRLEKVTDVMKEIQRGTRLLQLACGDAKARKLATVAKLVPSVKRSVEQFTLTVRALLKETGGAASAKVMNLRHKNLKGETVAEVMESEPSEAGEEADEDNESAEGTRSASTPGTRGSGKRDQDMDSS